MVFAHDTEVALAAAAALVNTATDDSLPDPAALDDFVAEWGWTGKRARSAAARRRELDAVLNVRPRLREVWHADEDRAAALVNDMLLRCQALPQLVKHDQWDYHLHADPRGASLDVRMVIEAAMAFVDVIRMKELDRLRVCASNACEDVLVDLSKNRSRRFCSTTCGNRESVAAYRARQAGQS